MFQIKFWRNANKVHVIMIKNHPRDTFLYWKFTIQQLIEKS
jgi:hypothetical protein